MKHKQVGESLKVAAAIMNQMHSSAARHIHYDNFTFPNLPQKAKGKGRNKGRKQHHWKPFR